MNVTETFVEHFIKTNYQNLDAITIERTKLRILDSFGVIMAGSKGPICSDVYQMLLEKGGKGEACVLGYEDKIPAASAAFITGLMARSFDYDAVMALTDDDRNKPAHISAATESAAIVAAQVNKSSGKDLICALALGDDFASRLVVFSGGGPSDVFDNTGTASGMGAVVAAGKLYKLNKEQFINAIGIMLNMLGGLMICPNEYSMSFKLPIANSARNAIFAVELAKAGLTCVEDPICGRGGYFDAFGAEYNTEHLLDSLGEKYLSDIVIKPWASCRMTHPGLTALLQATEGNTYEPDEIDVIEISLHPMAPEFLFEEWVPGNTSQPHAAFNLSITSAIQLIYGFVRPYLFNPEVFSNEAINELIAKIAFKKTEEVPTPNHAQIKIVLTNGTVLAGRVESAPLGDMVHNPFADDEVYKKFMQNVAYSGRISEEKAKNTLELLKEIQDQESICELVKLLSC